MQSNTGKKKKKMVSINDYLKVSMYYKLHRVISLILV